MNFFEVGSVAAAVVVAFTVVLGFGLDFDFGVVLSAWASAGRSSLSESSDASPEGSSPEVSSAASSVPLSPSADSFVAVEAS
jgi:hypothetical protein